MDNNRREAMIVENTALVHSIAHRFLGRGADYDDLYQAGCMGLIKAVDHFDESKGFQFSTYAVPVIMGEIRRLFRDGCAIKISRSLKEKATHLQAVRERFLHEENRDPTVSELAKLSGYPAEEIPELLNALMPVASLSFENEEGEQEWDVPVDTSEQLFARLSVLHALRFLTVREKKLLQYRFYEGRTQCETAALLGISQVQVSRNEKALLNKLRALLS